MSRRRLPVDLVGVVDHVSGVWPERPSGFGFEVAWLFRDLLVARFGLLLDRRLVDCPGIRGIWDVDLANRRPIEPGVGEHLRHAAEIDDREELLVAFEVKSSAAADHLLEPRSRLHLGQEHDVLRGRHVQPVVSRSEVATTTGTGRSSSWKSPSSTLPGSPSSEVIRTDQLLPYCRCRSAF